MDIDGQKGGYRQEEGGYRRGEKEGRDKDKRGIQTGKKGGVIDQLRGAQEEGKIDRKRKRSR